MKHTKECDEASKVYEAHIEARIKECKTCCKECNEIYDKEFVEAFMAYHKAHKKCGARE